MTQQKSGMSRQRTQQEVIFPGATLWFSDGPEGAFRVRPVPAPVRRPASPRRNPWVKPAPDGWSSTFAGADSHPPASARISGRL